MLDFERIKPFLNPIYSMDIFDEEFILDEAHLGKTIRCFGKDFIATDTRIDFAILGVGEMRGSRWFNVKEENSIHPVRAALYNLYTWHPDFTIVDLGDLALGQTLQDSYLALKEVCAECLRSDVKLIIIGGSHDLLIAPYQALREAGCYVHLCNVDAVIDLDKEKRYTENTFLEHLFFDEKTAVDEYTHVAFQSYFTHPKLLEILDRLQCHCYRLGYTKDHPYEIEPDVRSAQLFSLDLSSVASNFSPISTRSPNGLSGEEACMLTRFAGMSEQLKIFGVYGYFSFLQGQEFSAQLIAQMIWYVIEGLYFKRMEGAVGDKQNVNIFHTSFNELNTKFYQSKITKRWWMQVRDNLVVPCAQSDYERAMRNEIPERWLRYAGR